MSNEIQWERIPVSPSDLRALTKRSDLKGFAQAGSFFVIFLALGGLSYYAFLQQSFAVFVCAFFLHGTFSAMMEIPVHELGHGTPFVSKKMNSFFYKLFCFISWSNGVHYYTSHRLHHKYTCNEGTDYEIVLKPMKMSFMWIFYRFVFDLEKFIHRMKPNLYHVFGCTKADFFHWNEIFAKDDPKRKKMIFWSRCTVLGHGLLIALFIYLQQYILILIVNFPTFFATWLMHGCGMLQHEGLVNKANDWRKNTYSFKTNCIIGYLYWQMQYHLEHHTYAAVPFYNLKKLHELMVPKQAPVLKGYFSGLLHLYRVMLKQNQDPSYYFKPEFPQLKKEVQ